VRSIAGGADRTAPELRADHRRMHEAEPERRPAEGPAAASSAGSQGTRAPTAGGGADRRLDARGDGRFASFALDGVRGGEGRASFLVSRRDAVRRRSGTSVPPGSRSPALDRAGTGPILDEDFAPRLARIHPVRARSRAAIPSCCSGSDSGRLPGSTSETGPSRVLNSFGDGVLVAATPPGALPTAVRVRSGAPARGESAEPVDFTHVDDRRNVLDCRDGGRAVATLRHLQPFDGRRGEWPGGLRRRRECRPRESPSS